MKVVISMHATSTLRAPASTFRAIPKGELPRGNCPKSLPSDPDICRTLFWTANLPQLTNLPNFGISITVYIILKSSKGSREIRADSYFSFSSVLYKSYSWETVCLARRRPSWLAVVLNTGCAFLRLPVNHTVVFSGSDIDHGRSPWSHSVFTMVPLSTQQFM